MAPTPPEPQAAPEPSQPEHHHPQPAHLPVSMRLSLGMYTWAASNPRRFATAQRLVGWFGHVLAPSTAWLHLPAYTGWGVSRDFPRPATSTFHQRFAQKTQPPPDQAVQPAFQPSSGANQDERPAITASTVPEPGRALVDRFEQELTTLGVTFTACRPDELSAHLLALLKRKEITRLHAWEDNHLPAGLLESLQTGGIDIVHTADPELEAGLTGSMAGIAETGTLILTGGSGRPLTASLLPEFHIAILDSDRIYPSLEQLFKNQQPLRQEILDAPAAVFISGPSRTADIEMTLTIGVHGPREVHVFCLV
jgi:L-lactate dehydrogenase complex protein LldG